MSQLPIRKITLYNNGYATFHREGIFSGNSSIDLFFRKSDIQDVLKSISFSTEGEDSKICSVSYQDTKQGTSELSVPIPEYQSLTGLLRSLKGAKIRVCTEGLDSGLEGVLLGVETIENSGSAGRNGTFVNIIHRGGCIKTFDLLAVTNIEFLDDNVKHEIQYSLKAELSQLNRDLLRVTVFTQGSGQYLVKANYSLMAKEWTPSYRMELNPIEDERVPGLYKATLDVFAVVENTQEEDWLQVNMDIVSGAPPIPKSSDGDSLHDGAFPVMIKLLNSTSFTVRCDPTDTVEIIKRRIRSSQGYPISQQKLVFNGKQIETGRTLSDYNIRANSVLHLNLDRNVSADSDSNSTKPIFRLADQKNLSKYFIDTPISTLRNQSALVPILKSEIDITKVLLYNEDMRNGNPLSCIMFANTTGCGLERGSMVLKQGSTTLGECVMEQMWQKDEELYPYSVELGVEVKVETSTSRTKPHEVRILNGELSVYSYKEQTAMYTFDNQSDSSFPTVFLDHLYLEGWEVEHVHDKPIDITDRYYRYEFGLKSKEKRAFRVPEKRIDIQTYELTHTTKEQMEKFVKLGILNEEVTQQLLVLESMNTSVSELGARIYQLETEMRESKDTMDRLRKNIQVLPADSKAQYKYVQELSKEEDHLKLLEKTRKEFTEEKSATNQKLSQAANNMKSQYELQW